MQRSLLLYIFNWQLRLNCTKKLEEDPKLRVTGFSFVCQWLLLAQWRRCID